MDLRRKSINMLDSNINFAIFSIWFRMSSRNSGGDKTSTFAPYFKISLRNFPEIGDRNFRHTLPSLLIDTSCPLCQICSEIQSATAGSNLKQTSIDSLPAITPKFFPRKSFTLHRCGYYDASGCRFDLSDSG